MGLKIAVYNYNQRGFERACVQTIGVVHFDWGNMTAIINGREYASYQEYLRGVPGDSVSSQIQIDISDPAIYALAVALSDKIWEKHRAAKAIQDWQLDEEKDLRLPVMKSIDDLGGQVIELEDYQAKFQ